MTSTTFAWIVTSMRAGYAARGFVYLLVGVVSLGAALGEGEAEGFIGSLRRLKDAPMNEPILLVLALGLAAYAIWRGLDSVIDLAGHGRGFGWVERGGLFFVALLHLGFAWYAARLAFGGASFASGSGSQLAGVLSGMMSSVFGRGLIGLVGLGTVSFGFYSMWKGAFSRYRQHMRNTRAVERLAPLLGFGLIARGVVLALMGGFIMWAAWTLDPSVAGGYGQTLARIRDAWHGRVLLGIIGAGMVAFSFYCFCESAFRIVPPRPTTTPEEHGCGGPADGPAESRAI